MLGISHILGHYRAYKKTIDDFIEDNDAIVLELVPEIGEEPGFYEEVVQRCIEADKSIFEFDPRHDDFREIFGFLLPAEFVQGMIGYKKAICGLDKENFTLKNIARRGFFYYLCISTLFWGSFLRVISPGDVIKERYLYGSTDFTDLSVAEGLVKLSLSKRYKNIGVIYGRRHLDGIAYYLEHPVVRKIKKMFYLPYTVLSGAHKKEITYQGKSRLKKDLG